HQFWLMRDRRGGHMGRWSGIVHDSHGLVKPSFDVYLIRENEAAPAEPADFPDQPHGCEAKQFDVQGRVNVPYIIHVVDDLSTDGLETGIGRESQLSQSGNPRPNLQSFAIVRNFPVEFGDEFGAFGAWPHEAH